MDKSNLIKYGIAGLVTFVVGYTIYKAWKAHHNDPEDDPPEEEEKKQPEERFTDPEKEEIALLTRDDAEERVKVISNVNYDLVLSFINDDKTYEGYVRVTFDLESISKH